MAAAVAATTPVGAVECTPDAGADDELANAFDHCDPSFREGLLRELDPPLAQRGDVFVHVKFPCQRILACKQRIVAQCAKEFLARARLPRMTGETRRGGRL